MEKLTIEVKRYLTKFSLKYDMSPNDTIRDLKARVQVDTAVSSAEFDLMKSVRCGLLSEDLKLSEVADGSKVVLIFIKKNSLNAIRLNAISVPYSTSAQTGLPSRSKAKSYSSPNQDLLNLLLSLGYEKNLCSRALDASCNNVDRAAEYLANGKIPDLNSKIPKRARSNGGDIVNKSKDTEQTKHVDFSLNDQLTIKKLNMEGFDEYTVAQAYVACDKNEEATRAMLKQLK